MAVKKPVIHCDALIVHCMDYRLQKYLHPWIMARFGADNFDIISLAGSVHDYEMVLKYVQLAVKVHSIKTVTLINHEDCSAYSRDGMYAATNMTCWMQNKRSRPSSQASKWKPSICI
jgi:carbonic anhydrase